MKTDASHHYLVASDFDQTLSAGDSGEVLAELLGIDGFEERVRGLARQNFVQQGAELAYLCRHDPDFRAVRREHLVEVGKRIALKRNVERLPEFLDALSSEHRFSFFVISASPVEVVRSALEGIVPPERIHGTRFAYDETTGEIQSILHCPAGYGKVAVLSELGERLQIGRGKLVYLGDGSSDIHAMLHVTRLGGLTIAVSENRNLTPVARRTVLSDDVLGCTIPLLEEILGWDGARIQACLEARGLLIQTWDKLRADSLVIRSEGEVALAAAGG